MGQQTHRQPDDGRRDSDRDACGQPQAPPAPDRNPIRRELEVESRHDQEAGSSQTCTEASTITPVMALYAERDTVRVPTRK